MHYTAPVDLPSESSPALRKWGYFIGPLLFALSFLFVPPEGMSQAAWHVCGLAMWMACWWITEAMPLPVTSLLPVIVLPVCDILPMKNVIAPFSSPIIFLFLGGFMLSLAMEKWHLHVRIGLGLVHVIGIGCKSILAGVMLATAFMGMWISNTATVVMMLPMAISIALLLSKKLDNGDDMPSEQNMFAKAMVLGVAYSAVFGGLASFVGSPVNAVLQSTIEKKFNYSLTLTEWMSFGVPLTLILLAITWSLLTTRYLRKAKLCEDVREVVKDAFSKLGPMGREEKTVMAVFSLVAALWIFSKPLEHMLGIVLDDAVIGIFGGVLLFLIPLDKNFQRFTLNWRDTSKLPWGILVFFGGSLALSDALTETGAIAWLSIQLQAMHGMNIILIVTLVCLITIVATEFLSNVATITSFLPILAALAAAMNINPLIIMLPATLVASTGFALPGASAPNALAFGTGYLKMRDMLRTGITLDIISLITIVIFTFTIAAWALGIDLHSVPDWAKQ